jgi:hypothetical protein
MVGAITSRDCKLVCLVMAATVELGEEVPPLTPLQGVIAVYIMHCIETM